MHNWVWNPVSDGHLRHGPHPIIIRITNAAGRIVIRSGPL
jgi:hypothetical protein